MASGDAEQQELERILSELGLAATGAQVRALQRYLDLLEQWNGAFNLTAVRNRSAMLRQHLADCLAVVPALHRQSCAGRLLDVGSGAGLPGVVISILDPGLSVTCVDAVAKKAAFIRQVAGDLQLKNLTAVHTRVEALADEPFDLITSRAFSSLSLLASMTERLLASPKGLWSAMKGKWPETEITELPRTIDAFHVERLQVPGLDAERCLVWMRRRDVR